MEKDKTNIIKCKSFSVFLQTLQVYGKPLTTQFSNLKYPQKSKSWQDICLLKKFQRMFLDSFTRWRIFLYFVYLLFLNK